MTIDPYIQMFGATALGITSTIGVCVYLLKQQQKERLVRDSAHQAERKEERGLAEKRLDRMFEMMDDRVKEQTQVLERVDNTLADLARAQAELSGSIRDLGDKVEEIQQHVPIPTRGRGMKLETKKVGNTLAEPFDTARESDS